MFAVILLDLGAMPNLIQVKRFINRAYYFVMAGAERLRGYPNLKSRYAASFGVDPDLKNPKGFSEKVQWRKLNDRNALFPVFCDKLKSRDYIASRIGAKTAQRLLPKVLWQGRNSREIPFEGLRDGAVIKANHGSGWNIILEPGSSPDKSTIWRKCDRWLSYVFGWQRHEWGYGLVKPRLLAEELVRQDDGGHISDIKCFVFDGKPEFLYLVQYSTRNCGVFSCDWIRLNVTFHIDHISPYGKLGPVSPPVYLQEMIEVAQKLGAGVDMVRVDFLASESRFWIGEITVYPTSGIGYFEPASFERAAGDMWVLPNTG